MEKEKLQGLCAWPHSRARAAASRERDRAGAPSCSHQRVWRALPSSPPCLPHPKTARAPSRICCALQRGPCTQAEDGVEYDRDRQCERGASSGAPESGCHCRAQRSASSCTRRVGCRPSIVGSEICMALWGETKKEQELRVGQKLEGKRGGRRPIQLLYLLPASARSERTATAATCDTPYPQHQSTSHMTPAPRSVLLTKVRRGARVPAAADRPTDINYSNTFHGSKS